jgi:hypothetical protein
LSPMMDAAAPGNGEQPYDVRLNAETATLDFVTGVNRSPTKLREQSRPSG